MVSLPWQRYHTLNCLSTIFYRLRLVICYSMSVDWFGNLSKASIHRILIPGRLPSLTFGDRSLDMRFALCWREFCTPLCKHALLGYIDKNNNLRATVTSSPSIVNLRIQTFQFYASIGSRKPPIHFNNFRIAIIDPGLNLSI